MKHVRVDNHTQRHRLIDRLMAAGVPEDVRERIEGRGADDMSKRYGTKEAARAVMAEALAKAFPDS